MNSNRSAMWAIIGVVIGFSLPIVLCIGTFALLSFSIPDLSGQIDTLPANSNPFVQTVSGPNSGPAVGLIDVTGVIVAGSNNATPFNPGLNAAARDVIKLIEQTASDPDVKVLLLRVNSPGGSAVASDQIYNALEQVEQPVVVLMEEVAASGGYYISMAADHVMANPNTFTGSIGVIVQSTNISRLADTVGIGVETFTSGPNKDLLNPTARSGMKNALSCKPLWTTSMKILWRWWKRGAVCPMQKCWNWPMVASTRANRPTNWACSIPSAMRTMPLPKLPNWARLAANPG